MRNRAVVVLAFGLAACARAQRPPDVSPPPPPPPPTASTTATPPPVPENAAPPPLVLEPMKEPAPATPSAHVDIKFPIAEQVLSPAKVDKYVVRVTIEHWKTGTDGEGVEISLDGGRPRRLTSGTIPLRDLVSAGQELSPGAHFLSAAAIRSDGTIARAPKPTSLAPWALIRFWVGARGEREDPGPKVIVLQPQGTYNGEASANGAFVDCLPFYAAVGTDAELRVRVRGAGREGERVLSSWQPLALRELPSGDFTVECALVKGDAVIAQDQATITVNRDAPVKSD